MKLTFTDLNDMIRELKEKSVQSIRVNEVIRDVQVMIPDDYPMPIKAFSVYVTASIDGEWNEDLVAEYVEHVGSVDELAGEEVLSDLHRRTGNKVEILSELLAGEFLTVGSGRFEE